MNDLIKWKNSQRRKPLIVQGARQVGKTWLIKEFGRLHFDQTAYITFFDNENLQHIFDGSINASRILQALSIESGIQIDENTLVILDEIQECPRAIMALKSFAEQAPDLPVIAAGSLLGVALNRENTASGQQGNMDQVKRNIMFPVGKVNWLTLRPMTFSEFLRATGDTSLADLLLAADFDLISSFKEKFTDALRLYYFVGGMPEAVATYVETKEFDEVREVQNDLIFSYEHDFSKYASAQEAERIRQIWKSVPSQLARENKKFVYNAVKEGGRARVYESAIQWLVDAGLLTKVSRITKPGLPLSSYEDLAAFKLYMLDVGLLGACSKLDVSAIIRGNELFSEFKGALTEQYVCQQLQTAGVEPWYWSTSGSTAEVDFVFEQGGKVYPVEVKAAENLRSRSLKSFSDKYAVDQALRFSLSGYRDEGWMKNVPLYAIESLFADKH